MYCPKMESINTSGRQHEKQTAPNLATSMDTISNLPLKLLPESNDTDDDDEDEDYPQLARLKFKQEVNPHMWNQEMEETRAKNKNKKEFIVTSATSVACETANIEAYQCDQQRLLPLRLTTHLRQSSISREKLTALIASNCRKVYADQDTDSDINWSFKEEKNESNKNHASNYLNSTNKNEKFRKSFIYQLVSNYNDSDYNNNSNNVNNDLKLSDSTNHTNHDQTNEKSGNRREIAHTRLRVRLTTIAEGCQSMSAYSKQDVFSYSRAVKFFIICHLITQLLTASSPLFEKTIHHHKQQQSLGAISAEDWNWTQFQMFLFARAHKQSIELENEERPPDASEPNWLPVVGSGGGYGQATQRETRNTKSLLSEQQQNQIEEAAPIGERKTLRTSPLEFIKHSHQHHLHLDHHHHKHYRARPGTGEHVNLRDEKKSSTREERVRRRHSDNYYDSNYVAERPVVATKKGLVRGITQKLFTGKSVDAFLGIPYAQPPLGRYRFRHPQPTNEWQGELDASKMSNSCYQVNDTFFGSTFLGTSIWNANTPLSEDCLYLNIWTPFASANLTVVPAPDKANNANSANNNNNWPYRSALPGPESRPASASSGIAAKRPVLVWIFGGGFYSGTSTLALYEGGVLASEEDIIVVSMNYRVSALGFLYFGRPDSPGNAGLFDQLMALQWINDNIDQFGGDPNRVTIFGESAGAVSVALHLLSPLSRNLFAQAILQSGAATCPWGFKEPKEIISNGLQLAAQVNCPSNNSDLDQVVECLLKVDPMTLVSQEVGQTKTILPFPFVPVVDGSFLVESPIESMSKSNFKQAKILLGSNYDEGNSFLIYLPEFSHCPSSQAAPSNGNGNGESKQISQTQADQNRASDDSANADSLVASQFSIGSQTGPSSLESLDLLTAGRQNPAAHQAAYTSSSVSSATTNSVTPETDVASNSNSQTSDPKPCKPNEELTLKRDDFLRVLREDLNPYAEDPVGKEAIVFEYSNWNNPSDTLSNYDALDKIVGDYYFTCHVNDFALRYANAGNSVFMYYFKQRSSTSPWPKWMGVLHGDEVNFVFGEPLNANFKYTAQEVELSRRMMKYWANFAKYGNPTKAGENISMAEKWPEYADKRQYFELHGDFVRIGRGPRAKQCAFWSHYLPKLLETFAAHQQCPNAKQQFRLPSPYPRELISSGQADSMALSGRNGFLSNVPSSVLVCLSVILVLTIISLLIYAKRTWKLDFNLSSSSGNSD